MSAIVDGVVYTPQTKYCDMTGQESLGQTLVVWRKEAKLTLATASGLIGCTKSYLWEMENNRAEPSLRMAKKIAAAYSVPIAILAGRLSE